MASYPAAVFVTPLDNFMIFNIIVSIIQTCHMLEQSFLILPKLSTVLIGKPSSQPSDTLDLGTAFATGLRPFTQTISLKYSSTACLLLSSQSMRVSGKVIQSPQGYLSSILNVSSTTFATVSLHSAFKSLHNLHPIFS